jgi:parallel beta-helix repeat protein
MFARRSALLLTSLLAACAGAADKTGGGGVDDTASGGDDGGPDYEEGCITVDGEGGYAWINDAIAVAEPGAVIMLCAATAHEEAVLVDKAVSIVGPGAENFYLVPPINTDGFTLTAAGASVEGVSVSATRSGFSVSANDVVLRDISVVTNGNWGVESSEASGLLIERATLLGNVYGGIKVDGGAATLRDSVLDANVTYGGLVTGGGTLTVDTCEVKNTTLDESDDTDDGIGIYAEDGATIESYSSTYTGNTFVSLYAEGASLSMSGDTVSGGLYGAVATDGEANFTGVTVTDSVYLGILASTTRPITVSEVTVSGDPTLTVDISDEDWGSRSVGYVGAGLLLGGDNIQVTDSSVTGYNDAGLVILPYTDGAENLAVVERVTLTNNGRHGAYVNGVTLQATDLTVTGVIEVEDQGENRCLTVDRYGAVVLVSNQASFTGGRIADNEGYGISAVQATATVDGTAFSGNTCAGLMNFRGGAVVTNADFEKAGPDALNASLVDYQSVGGTYVYDSTFHDSNAVIDDVYESTDGTYTYTTIYRSAAGVDVYVSEGAGFEAAGNTFTNGTNGILLYSANATLDNNTFTNYANTAISASLGTVEVTDTTLDGFGGYGVQCSQGSMNFEDSTVTNGGEYSYHYEYYTDGVLNYSFDSSYSGYALYAYDCALTVQDVDFSEINGAGMWAYASSTGSYELDGVTFTNVAQAASSSYTAITFYLYAPSSAAYLTDVTVTGAPYNGLYVYTSMAAGSYADLVTSGLTMSEVGNYGALLSGTSLRATFDGADISASGSYGLFSSGLDSLTLTNSAITGTGASGAYVGATQATITGNTLTGNAYYGVECSVTSLDACYGNDLSSNGIAEQNGCDEECSAL